MASLNPKESWLLNDVIVSYGVHLSVTVLRNLCGHFLSWSLFWVIYFALILVWKLLFGLLQLDDFGGGQASVQLGSLIKYR